MNLDQVKGTAKDKVHEKFGHGLPVTCATCAPEGIAVIDKKEVYDSLDAFCAEYGFDAATKQRMRDDILATALKTDIVSSQTRRSSQFARGARTLRAGTHDK